MRALLAAVALLATALATLPAAPAAAEGSGDYEQVVDLTFPLANDGTAYHYSNDYHSPRSRGDHGATDIMAAHGTPVHAVVGGTVTQVIGTGCGWSSTGWGYAVIIEGDDGRDYWYLHLGTDGGPTSEAYASGLTCGSEVERGQLIGYVGSSGNASPSHPHLHLEIRDDSVTDPQGDGRINPYFSLKDAEARGDYPGADAAVAEPPVEPAVDRLAGAERIATAAAVAKDLWPDGSEEVVLATARDHADAVAGTALAAVRDAPLLLANRDALTTETEERITALDPDVVWLLGGEAALAAEVADAVAGLGVDRIERLAGEDRFGTAAEIADEVGAPDGRVALAAGHPDADFDAWPPGILAGALTTGGAPVPLLLTHADGLPEATVDALEGLKPSSAYLLAEDGETTAGLADEIAEAGAEVTELGGADRYELAANVLAQLDERDGPLVLATGNDYPDGLAAGAAAARVGGSLTLVPPEDLDGASSLVDQFQASAYDGTMTIGGPAAIADRVVMRVHELIDS